jgi:hypothetical protein
LLSRIDGSIRPELKPVIDVLPDNEPIPLPHCLGEAGTQFTERPIIGMSAYAAVRRRPTRGMCGRLG